MTDAQRPGRSRRRFTVDALFADTRPRATGVVDLADAKQIDLDRIESDPDQPRRSFDDERLEELAASIRTDGVLQPIVVRYDEPRDVYVIVHGERRWRASKLANQTSIPALVRDVPAERRLVHQLVENVVREDLNAVDRSAALRALRRQLDDAPWEQVAEVVGIKRSRLFQLLGTEKLPEGAQKDIQEGRLSEKQSRALQGLPPVKQEALRALMVEHTIAAPVALRLARAFRGIDVGEDADLAAQEVKRLYALIDPRDAEALRQQTHTVLDAVRTGTASDLAQLIAAPSFNGPRVTRDIATLSRALTRTSRSALRQDDETRETLRKLRDALDALLG